MARPREASKGALILINTTSFSAASTVGINNCFSNLYDNYRIVINVTSATTNFDPLFLRMRSDTTDNSSNNYKFQQRYFFYGGSAGDGTSTAISGFPIASVDAGAGNLAVGLKASIDVIGPFLTSYTAYSYLGTQNNYNFYGGGIMTVNTSYNGCSFTPAAGNITGTLSIYGYRK